MWGRIVKETIVANGIKSVSCEGHGGILITFDAMQQNQSLKLLRDMLNLSDFETGTGYAFEEDCEAAIVSFLLSDEELKKLYPHRTPEQIRISNTKTLINTFPEIYTYYTRKELQIFESVRLMDLHIVNCGIEVCKYNGSRKSAEDNDIPTGHHLILAYDPRNGKSLPHNFLATDEQMLEIEKRLHLPLDTTTLTQYPRA